VINSKHRQQGTFTIELSIIAMLLGAMLYFSADVAIKLSMQSQLDRLSYASVTLLKERTQLYGDEAVITQLDVDQIYTIIKESLGRTKHNFDPNKLGLDVQQIGFGTDGYINEQQYKRAGNLVCRPSTPLALVSNLSVETIWGRKAPLYMVTVCYDTINLAPQLWDGSYTRITSSSVQLGR